MKIINETAQPDASAWSALVDLRGIRFVASYVAGRLSVRLAPYKRPPRVATWMVGYVKEWAGKRLALLPDEWFEAHRALYGVAA